MKGLAVLGLVLLMALPCGRAEEDRPAVTKGELVVLKARFAKVKAREDLWRKEIEKELKDAEALKTEKMRVESLPRLLAYLRVLLMRGETAFHVKSVANRPDPSLKPLITDFQN